MWGTLALSVGSQYLSMRNAAGQQQDEINAINRRNEQARQLAAESLALTYNSVLNKSYEAALNARRTEEDIKRSGRAAEGKALVQAGVTGAAGRRVELTRRIMVQGGVERAMTRAERDHYNEQSALIDRADMEERAMMNRLLSTQENMPSSFDPVMAGIGAALNVYNDYMDEGAYQENRVSGLIQTAKGTGYAYTGSTGETRVTMAAGEHRSDGRR